MPADNTLYTGSVRDIMHYESDIWAVADLLLAAYDGQPGGTAMTIGYAKANGVTVQIIRPVLPAA